MMPIKRIKMIFFRREKISQIVYVREAFQFKDTSCRLTSYMDQSSVPSFWLRFDFINQQMPDCNKSNIITLVQIIVFFIMIIILLVLFLADKAQNCELDPIYAQHIEENFKPFEDGITADMIETLRKVQLPQKCLVTLANGTVKSNCDNATYGQYFFLYRDILKEFVDQFPPMELVITLIDDPNLYKHQCEKSAHDPLWPCNCDKDFGPFPKHAYFQRTQVTKVFEKVPVFASCIIKGCTNDILLPSIYHLNTKQTKLPTLPSWEQRSFKVYWRGSISEIFSFPQVENPQDFSHRIRLLSKCTDNPDCDAKTMGYYTIPSHWLTKIFKIRYPLVCRNDMKDWARYKIIFDIDGATFSARFASILKLGSAIFKAHAFEDIGSIGMKAWEHFVPVKMDLSDLEEKIEWARNNNQKLKEIAQRGRERSMKVHNYQTYKCYIWHLLKKYQQLLRKGGVITQ